MLEYINISWKYKWTQCYTKIISTKKEIFLAATAISREYRFALCCITCEGVPVDNMDHLTTIFSCRRKTNRWPMVLFFNMLDVAGVAAFIIWISLNPDWSFNDRQERWRKFLKQLGQELTNDYIQVCLQTQSCLKSNVRNALKMIGKLHDLPQLAPAAENRPQKRCRLCPTRIDKKTPGVWNICNRNVCPAYSSKVELFTCWLSVKFWTLLPNYVCQKLGVKYNMKLYFSNGQFIVLCW